jgi:glycerol kinase
VNLAVALDLGTTAIKAGLLSAEGAMIGIVSHPAPAITVQAGRYESDALAYAEAAEAVLKQCLAQTAVLPPLGLCCQRSSFLIWVRDTGRPVSPLISWQDDRGAPSCEVLRPHEAGIRELSGLPLTPYYFAPKLRMLLREHPEWRARLESGEWLVGTLDTFLIWRWTGGKLHVTDASMAARTQLLDVTCGNWSEELCALFDIPLAVLPTIRPSFGVQTLLDDGLILQASLADQSAALAASIEPGQAEALVNLGTGGFVVCYLPEGERPSPGYLQTLVWRDAAGRSCLAAEGTLNSIASALAPWPVGESRPEAMGSSAIFALAEPSGIGAPYFRSDLGTRFSEPIEPLAPAEVAILLQEAIVFRVARILEDFSTRFGISRACLSGGLASLLCLNQGVAACGPVDVCLLAQSESSLTGAARLAAGWPPHAARQTVPVVRGLVPARLTGKFLRWKAWLDGLLNQGAAE